MSHSAEDIYKEQLPNVVEGFKNVVNQCTLRKLANRFPIVNWLPHYKLQYLLPDFIAGFTVGLTTIPQAIAYGVVAGLEPQYGLYSAFMGCFTYILFGSCKDVTIATTAIMAIMVHPYAVLNADLAVLLCFLVGCIILVLGLLNMGVLIRFISVPIITGFTIAAATTIGSAQVNNLFGIKSPSNQFIASWKHFLTHLMSIRWHDALLGISTLAFLLAMKHIKNVRWGSKSVWKYLCLSRNAFAVIFGTFLAYILSRNGSEPFRVTGNITAGLPPFQPPPFSTTINGTHYNFLEILSIYKAALGFVPIVAILEIVAIAKAFSQGKIVSASQEMIALGMCNIMGSFIKSMPVTGSFTRTALNNASGVRTPLGGAVTGTLVLLALAFLTQTFYYIPKSTLAAIIIAAMISLIETDKVIDIWRSKRYDCLPFLVTLFACLFWSLEYGILCGVFVNMTFILFRSATPKILLSVENVNNYMVIVVSVKESLDYVSAEYIYEKILKFVNSQNSMIELVIIDGQYINSIDYTVALNLLSLEADLKLSLCGLIFWKWRSKTRGVICRLNKDKQSSFFNEDSLGLLVNSYFDKRSRRNSEATVLSEE